MSSNKPMKITNLEIQNTLESIRNDQQVINKNNRMLYVLAAAEPTQNRWPADAIRSDRINMHEQIEDLSLKIMVLVKFLEGMVK